MRLATIRDGDRTLAVRADGDEAVELPAADVRELLGHDGWQDWAAADGPRRPIAGLDFAPLIPSPDKILCVGLNYRSHIQETGREEPTHPTLFAKFRSALIGANDDIALPAASQAVDWEAELAVIVGARARHVSVDDAPGAIAGMTIGTRGSGARSGGDNCFTDWDGRSNSTVCE